MEMASLPMTECKPHLERRSRAQLQATGSCSQHCKHAACGEGSRAHCIQSKPERPSEAHRGAIAITCHASRGEQPTQTRRGHVGMANKPHCAKYHGRPLTSQAQPLLPPPSHSEGVTYTQPLLPPQWLPAVMLSVPTGLPQPARPGSVLLGGTSVLWPGNSLYRISNSFGRKISHI